MKIHILGICGTFMGGLAILAREAGLEVSGSDSNVYPPMSVQLQEQGITLFEGYDPAHLEDHPDLVVIGNAMSRGNPCVEYILNHDLQYCSGPQWLYENVLRNRHVLAVSGTHGKTTTASMLAWILEDAGLQPGFLIGGVPGNFGVSARLGKGRFFVVEADEYDTAFFDKRSKFVHYHPKTLIISNIEFDHADIFQDIGAIKTQFHHLVRTMPSHGLIIANNEDENIRSVLDMGCWTPVEYFGGDGSRYQARILEKDQSEIELLVDGQSGGIIRWDLMGQHNIYNALAAVAASAHAGLTTGETCEALASFSSVKRRMEELDVIDDIHIYDDFAHHPTEIRTTLEGLRARVGKSRIIAIMEPRSNTMRQGNHMNQLAGSLGIADLVFLYQFPGLTWDLQESTSDLGNKRMCMDSVDAIVRSVADIAEPGDHVVIMSNGSFDGIHQKLIGEIGRNAA